MATLININGIDYTNNIALDSYNVNSADVYSEWTDANGIAHRQPIRERVSGDFTIAFKDYQEYSEFVSHIISSKKAGGFVPAYLFVNNINRYKSTNLFITFEPIMTKKTADSEYISPFKVKIIER